MPIASYINAEFFWKIYLCHKLTQIRIIFVENKI